MMAYAVLEWKLSEALERCLGLSAVQGAIINANISFRDKCSIVKTILSLVAGDDAKKVKSALEKISKSATDRNKIAHNSFFANKNRDGIRIYTIHAKGSFDYGQTVWSQKYIQNLEDRLFQLGCELDKYVELFADTAVRILEKKKLPADFFGAISNPQHYPSPNNQNSLLTILEEHGKNEGQSPSRE